MTRPPWWQPLARRLWDDDARVARALAEALGSYCSFCDRSGHDVVDCDALDHLREDA